MLWCVWGLLEFRLPGPKHQCDQPEPEPEPNTPPHRTTPQYIGKAFSKCLQEANRVSGAVFLWLKQHGAMAEMNDRYNWFAPLVVAIGEKSGLCKAIKIHGRAGHHRRSVTDTTQKEAEIKELLELRQRYSKNENSSSGVDGEESGGGGGGGSSDYDEDESEDYAAALADRLGDAEDRVLDIDTLLETGEDIDETDTQYVTQYVVVKRKKASLARRILIKLGILR